MKEKLKTIRSKIILGIIILFVVIISASTIASIIVIYDGYKVIKNDISTIAEGEEYWRENKEYFNQLVVIVNKYPGVDMIRKGSDYTDNRDTYINNYTISQGYYFKEDYSKSDRYSIDELENLR